MSHPFDALLRRIPSLSLESLAARVRQFEGKRILVLGDAMLDEYIWGEVSRISPEAPVPVVEARRHTFGLGGAANVANNVQALGARVRMIGVIGDDAPGRTLADALESRGIDVSGLVRDAHRPTTTKLRIVAHSHAGSQQIVRVDRETRARIDDATAERLLNVARSVLPDVDAVLISDYNKGIWGPSLAHPLLQECRRAGVASVVNMKPANAGCLEGATLVTSNHHEASVAALSLPSAMQPEGTPDWSEPERMEEAGRQLRPFFGCDHLVITHGARGLSLFGEEATCHLPPIPAEVYDGTGAGDTVVSMAAMTLAAGGTPLEAAVLGNAGGAIQVHRLGAVAVSAEELLLLITDGIIEEHMGVDF